MTHDQKFILFALFLFALNILFTGAMIYFMLCNVAQDTAEAITKNYHSELLK